MTEDRFIHKHTKTWKQLDDILNIISKKGYDNIDFSTLKDLDRLYRQVSAHLSYSATYFPGSAVSQYLNALVSRGHNFYYIRKKGKHKSIIHFFSSEIPYLIASNWQFVLISFGLFLAGSLFSYILTKMDIRNAYAFLSEDIIKNLNIGGGDSNNWNNPIMSGVIMTNNINVSLKAFAYGISLGLGTVYILLTNGFMLGSLSALAIGQGKALVYWSLILPHGFIELSAIFIGGAAGLKIGYSLIRPGVYRRKDALIIAAKEALKMMGIVVPMLVIAGIIEGFFTPSSFSPEAKLVFACAALVLLLLYFGLGFLIKPDGMKKGNE